MRLFGKTTTASKPSGVTLPSINLMSALIGQRSDKRTSGWSFSNLQRSFSDESMLGRLAGCYFCEQSSLFQRQSTQPTFNCILLGIEIGMEMRISQKT
jgi:hypothetical protein